MRAREDNVLLFDAGNTLWSDRSLARETKGKITVETMNLMGYDAAVLGERDLLLGAETLRERFNEADFPFLSANVVDEEGNLLAQPYTAIEVGGRRVGVLGLTGQALPAGVTLRVLDPLETARRYLPELRKQTDFIIVLAHLNREYVRMLMEAQEGIDVIVWGGAKPPLPRPIWDENAGTLAVAAEVPTPGYAGRRIGFLKLKVDEHGQIISYDWDSVKLTPDFPDDQEMLELLRKYR